MKKSTLAMLTGLAAGSLAGYWAYLFFNQQKLVFSPTIDGIKYHGPSGGSHKVKSVELPISKDVCLRGQLTWPADIQSNEKLPCLIYFGGRSEDVSWLVGYAHHFHSRAIVLYMNYRGYGHSTGEPSESALISDACAIFDWAKDHDHVDPEMMVAVGRSLGSGVAVQLATLRSVAKLVLITPYDSLVEVAKRQVSLAPIRFLLKHKFNSLQAAKELRCPTLVVLAQTDDVVTHEHSNRLIEVLGSCAKVVCVRGTNHYNIPHLRRTQKEIQSFLSA